MKFSKIYKVGISGLLRTLWFNFRYLPFSQAVKLPFLLTGKVHVGCCRRGNIILTDCVKPFMVYLGADLTKCYNQPSLYRIEGKWIIKGSGSHVIGVGAIVLIGKGASLEIGNNLSIGNNSRIYCAKRITIGNENLWSHYNIVRDGDGHSIRDDEGCILNPNREVVIGEHVWIGFGCSILKGTVIPDGSIVGAKSLINSILPPPTPTATTYTATHHPPKSLVQPFSQNIPYSSEEAVGGIYVGQPAKLVKSGIKWSYEPPKE